MLNLEELGHSCKEFAQFFQIDVNAEELSKENLYLRKYLKSLDTNANENINDIRCLSYYERRPYRRQIPNQGNCSKNNLI